MTSTRAPTRKYVPRPVSDYFRLDWYYAEKMVRMPTLGWASQLIVAIPILTKFPGFEEWRVALIWASALSFVIAWAILRARMPFFLQEYPSFKAYIDRGNAHRWILWQFHQNIDTFVDPENTIEETIDKGLSFRADDANPGYKVYGAAPIFTPLTRTKLHIFSLVNLNNDLYLPFQCGNLRYVLPIQECDPNVEKREKELFWVTYTALASSRPYARFLTWSFLAIGAACFFAGIVLNVIHLWAATPVTTLTYV